MLTETARTAAVRGSELEPVRTEGEVELSVTTFTRVQAERAAEAEGVELTDERTFTVREATPPGAMVAIWRGIEMALRENPEWLR